jgi:hypothetical protein
MNYAIDARIQPSSTVQIVYPEHVLLHGLRAEVLELVNLPVLGKSAELATTGLRGFAFNVALPLRFLRFVE